MSLVKVDVVAMVAMMEGATENLYLQIFRNAPSLRIPTVTHRSSMLFIIYRPDRLW